MNAAQGRLLLIDAGGTIAEGARRTWRRHGPRKIAPGPTARFLTPSRSSLLRRIADYDYVYFTDQPSPDVDPRLWMDVAKAINKHKHRYAGFVVTHGTDTLTWVAATLGFALWGFPGSVVVTGAMRPLACRGSDGWPNLIHSFRVASSRRVRAVCVVFGNQIFHGCRVRKVASSSGDVFDAPGRLGRIGKTLRLERTKSRQQRTPNFLDGSRRFLFDNKVACVVVSPNLTPAALTELGHSRGIVLETYPSGTIPRRLLPALEKLSADRPVVVSVENGHLMAPSVPRYPTFLTSAKEMTREATVVKLMWALGQFSDRESVRHLMTSDVVGELGEGI